LDRSLATVTYYSYAPIVSLALRLDSGKNSFASTPNNPMTCCISTSSVIQRKPGVNHSEVRLSSSGLTPTNLNTTIQIRFADTVLCSFRIESRG